MQMQLRMRTCLVAGLLAAAALAGCGAGSSKDSKGGTVDKASEKVTLRLGYFPNITHASALVGVEKGIFAEKLGSNVTLDTSAFNAGPEPPSRPSSPAPSTPPTSAPTRPSTPSPSPTARRSGSSPGATSGGAFLVVKPEHRQRRPTSRARRSPPRSSATPRTWRCAAGSRRAGLSRPTPQGGGDVSIVPQENARDPRDLPGRRHRRRLGARAVGHPAGPGGRRQGPRRRAGPLARRPVRHHPPHRAHRLPEGAPRRRRSACSRARSAAIDFVNAEPRRGQEAGQRRDRTLTGKAARPGRDRRRLGEPHLHRRPDRRLAPQGRGRRRAPSACSTASRPRRHLRPDAPQRGPQGRPARPEVAVVERRSV